jgi:hypothetical protein
MHPKSCKWMRSVIPRATRCLQGYQQHEHSSSVLTILAMLRWEGHCGAWTLCMRITFLSCSMDFCRSLAVSSSSCRFSRSSHTRSYNDCSTHHSVHTTTAAHITLFIQRLQHKPLCSCNDCSTHHSVQHLQVPCLSMRNTTQQTNNSKNRPHVA